MSQVLTDARRACSRGVLGSTMGTYPRARGAGSNPVEGNGHSFAHTVRSIFRFPADTHKHTLSLSLTHTHARACAHTHTHTHTHTHPRIPSRAMGTFFPHTVSSIFRLSLTHTTHAHRHTHARTHTETTGTNNQSVLTFAGFSIALIAPG